MAVPITASSEGESRPHCLPGAGHTHPGLDVTGPAWDPESEQPADATSRQVHPAHGPGRAMSFPFPNLGPGPLFSPTSLSGPPLTLSPPASRPPAWISGSRHPPQCSSHRGGGGGGTSGGGSPPPPGRETPQPAPGRGAGWRLGLGTTGSPSQIPFPTQLQPYRVPSFKGSGSGVLSGAAPALSPEASPRSALPAHDRFPWRALVIPAKQGRQNGEINSVEGC